MADFKQNYFQRRTKDRGPRSNNRISSPEVQVIGSDGENLGVLNTNEAISIAKEQGLDLIEISPNAKPDDIYLNDIDNEAKICGEYYKCCWPCLCDVMKYASTKKINLDFNGEKKDIYTIVINNPCNKNDFPELVNREYFCDGDKLNEDYTFSVDGKLVIGLMHNGKVCDDYDIDYVDNHQITGPMCEARNSMPLDDLNFGMGDIFIKLAR